MQVLPSLKCPRRMQGCEGTNAVCKRGSLSRKPDYFQSRGGGAALVRGTRGGGSLSKPTFPRSCSAVGCGIPRLWPGQDTEGGGRLAPVTAAACVSIRMRTRAVHGPGRWSLSPGHSGPSRGARLTRGGGAGGLVGGATWDRSRILAGRFLRSGSPVR